MQTDQRFLLQICIPFILGLLVLLGIRSADRFIDSDELEHLNSAYFMTRGESIYGSFFENHPPLTAILLQPVVRSSEDPQTIIHCGRGVMFGLSVVILVAVGVLARPIAGWASSLLATTLLLSTAFFLQKAIEVRPDVPALLCLIIALILLQRAVVSTSWRGAFAAGAVFCIAGLFTPKVIFAAAGATLAAGFATGLSKGWRSGLWMLVLIVAGAVAVAAIAAGELARRGLLSGFISDAVIVSLKMTVEHTAEFRWLFLKTTLTTSLVVWVLAVLGVVVLVRNPKQYPSGYVEILCGSLVGGIVGLFLIQAPLRQYFLTFLPQVAVVAAAGLISILNRIPERWPWQISGGIVLFILLGATIPSVLAESERAPSMKSQVEAIKNVCSMTSRDDRVLDFGTGMYLTRLPAYRYFFLNSDVQRLFPSEVIERDLLRVLDDPQVKLIIGDPQLAKLPTNVLLKINSDFAPTQHPPILLRRPPNSER